MTEPVRPFAPGEKPWAIACLGSFLSSFGFMLAAVFSKSDTPAYLSAGFALVFLMCRWRLQIIEDQQEPDKARRRTLGRELAGLLIAVLIFGVLVVAARIIRALLGGESVSQQIGIGLMITAGAFAVLAGLKVLGRIARSALFPDLRSRS